MKFTHSRQESQQDAKSQNAGTVEQSTNQVNAEHVANIWWMWQAQSVVRLMQSVQTQKQRSKCELER